MSVLNSYNKKIISDFQGFQSLPEESDVSTTGALQADNVEFAPGRVGSRLGWTEIFDSRAVITSIVSWINAGWNRIVFTVGNVVKFRDLPTGVDATLFTPSGGTGTFHANVVAPSGNRVYIASYNTIQTGYTEARVTQQDVSAITTDKIAAGPQQATVLPATGADVGVITAGTHLFGFIPVSRSGFWGKFSPVDAGTGGFEPVAYTAPGGNNVTVTVTPATVWPADAYQVKAIMTVASNQGRFYLVPSSAGTVSQGVVPGAGAAVVFNFSISDDDLISSAQDATGYQAWFTQDASGNMATFYPHYVLQYGERMVWIGEYAVGAANVGTSTIFISEPSNHQAFSIDQHQITLPGNRRCLSAFVQNQTLYLVGPYWTYAVSDNGDVPSTWAAPRLVDGAIGSPAIQGVCENASQGFAWVVSEKGLYLFAGGSYLTLPVSYLQQPTWNLIDWASPHVIRVVDNPGDRQVRVSALHSGGVYKILTFDYTNGTGPTQVKCSLDTVTASSLNVGTMALVQHPATKVQETWISAGTGKVLRRAVSSDDFPYTDVGVHSAYYAPSSVYETSLYPGLNVSQGEVYSHHGAHMRVKGNGLVASVVNALDRVVAVASVNLSAILAPGKELLRRFILNSESVSYYFSTGAWKTGVANVATTAVTKTSGSDFSTEWLAGTKFKILTEGANFKRSDTTLTSIVVSSNVGTVTAPLHGRVVGELVHVTGATVDTDLNGLYVVQSVPGVNQFTINTTNVSNATYTESTLTCGATTITSYDIASVTSASALTLSSTAGTLTGVRWYVEPWWSLSNIKHYWSRYVSSR